MKKAMKMWHLQVPAEAESQVKSISVSNTGHIVITFKSETVVQDISDGIGGPAWMMVPIVVHRELVVRARKVGK